MGEHRAVMWNWVNCNPFFTTRSIIGAGMLAAKAAELAEANIVNQHSQHVGGVFDALGAGQLEL